MDMAPTQSGSSAATSGGATKENRGACRSRIPLTSERQVTGAGLAEATATTVHRILGQLGAEPWVLCWNAVPYHPHPARCHDSNRRPTPQEVAACQGLLATLCAGRRVIAVGRVAAAAASQVVGAEVPYVRHPAHGGARAFAEGLASLLAEPLAAAAANLPLQGRGVG